MLRWYATSYYYKTSAWPDRLVALLPSELRSRAEKELRRRRLDELDDRLVRRAWETEFLERPIGRFISRDIMRRLQAGRHARFPARLLRLFEREPVEVIWGPQDCVEAFEKLKKHGVVCILDQAVGHFASLDRVLREEHERHPDFFGADQVGISGKALDRQRRATEVADLIVVGSEFAAQTMIDNSVDPRKLRIVPYGYDERRFPTEQPRRQPLNGRPTEFLFVGLVGARKGAAYMLEAFRGIDARRARLTLVGPLDLPSETFARYARDVNYVGSVTRAEVLDHMRRADCLILPSLFEGSALVLLEALAMGLPIIQTASSGLGAQEGVNGIVLKEVSADHVRSAAESVIACMERTRNWGDASWQMRADRTWANYRSAVRDLVQSVT